MDGNLKVNDAEYEQFAEAIKKAGETAEEQLKTYFEILQKVLDSAITSGVVYENLNLFHQQAQILTGTVGNITNIVGADCSTYIADINAADEYLYD